ncbi:MAG: hypothetical protein H0V45_04540 [Actinobacteria bacterium]|nr:hypothetical protein [Actinomycetota bacterium]
MYWHDGFDWFWMSLMMVAWVVLLGVAVYVAVKLAREQTAALREGDSKRR